MQGITGTLLVCCFSATAGTFTYMCKPVADNIWPCFFILAEGLDTESTTHTQSVKKRLLAEVGLNLHRAI